MARSGLQTALRLIYPPRCLSCGVQVDSDFGLCPTCWRDTPFLTGLQCDACGAPLPGRSDPDEVAHCDDCLQTPRPWSRGRTVMLYHENARKLVMALKHGDRQDIAGPAGRWMADRAKGLVPDTALVVPVPLHWSRLLKRRYNQAGLLAEAVARELGLSWCPDALIRPKPTRPLEDTSRDARFAALDGAIQVHPRRRHRMVARPVLIVDDVMTSGATLAACAEACLSSRASEVCVVTLARTVRDA